jgi:glycosyltransferase involved in cell wall biosynthesis
VIYNGVELPSLKRQRPKAFDIGFLGRLHPQKNPVILVDILAAMRPARPTLCVIGSGELDAELRRRVINAGISDQVTFCGERPRREALEFLAQCRTLALPSLSEGHPLAPIEAMLLDVPVVASDIPNNREIIDDGHNGFLVALPGIPVFAQRFARLLGDESLRQSIAAEARRRAQTAFSIDEHFERYLRLYARLIGPSAAPGFATEGRTSERA